MSDLPFAGTLKMWKSTASYGFVTRDGDYRDCFLHLKVLRTAGIEGLAVGARVAFDVIEDRYGRLRVSKITCLEHATPGAVGQ